MQDLLSILTFQSGLNAAVVLAGAGLLGGASGLTGVFMLLRKRSLISDVVSHAALPGLCIGFIAGWLILGQGRSLPVLMLGSMLGGVGGVLAVQWIRDNTRLTEDTALASVLSVSFGIGAVLLSVIQQLPTGGMAGLKTMLLGSTATLRLVEAQIIGAAALMILLACIALAKEFALAAFDPGYAEAGGWPVRRLDLALMGLMLMVVATGLSTVGLVLIVALLIIPAATARLCTDRLGVMMVIATLSGAVSGWLGAGLSALDSHLPAGAVIVLVAGAQFILAVLFGPARGVVPRLMRTRLRGRGLADD
ncbi:MAG: hypothetical protein Alpg2KO_19100 [Alphaproteobacteria bacterium]